MPATEQPRFGLTRMRPRDPSETHRAASPLELFFDLVFVVAVSLSSAQLHHAESGDHVVSGVGAYLMVFFAIWWAWMNFTWFATAFDTDDWLYRVVTILQMGGVLVLAAGAAPAMDEGDWTLVTIGYVIMRLAMVAQWLRASRGAPELRTTSLRYAVGITALQVLWVARLWLPGGGGVLVFLLLVLGELAVPVWAERSRPTPWHPGHIAERHGLFTLIVLGESVLASTSAVVDGGEHVEHLGPLVLIAVCGLTLAAGMWWTYFSREHDERLGSLGSSLVFGYGHYVVFAAAGAFSAGIEVAIDHDTHSTGLAASVAAATLTVPVGVFIVAVWVLTLQGALTPAQDVLVPVLGVAVAVSALLPFSLPVAALLVVAVVVVLEVGGRGEPGRGSAGSADEGVACALRGGTSRPSGAQCPIPARPARPRAAWEDPSTRAKETVMTPTNPAENAPETSPSGSTPHGRDAGDTAPGAPPRGADGPTTADPTVVLLHHVRGLTPGVLALAERLREGGHRVVTPDLFEGQLPASTEAGFALVEETGQEELGRRADAAVEAMGPVPGGIVWAGISWGAALAQERAQTRPDSRGALLYESFVSLTAPWAFGPWPQDVPAQVHGMSEDPFFAHEGDLEAAREAAGSVGDHLVEVFEYPGDRHLFTDSSLPSHDSAATEQVLARSLGFLDALR